MKTNKFEEEVVPVTVVKGLEKTAVLKDEYPKLGCTLESLQKLKSVFRKVSAVFSLFFVYSNFLNSSSDLS